MTPAGVDRHVEDCPRCGGSHYLELRRLTRPAGPYTLWGKCEATGEPVFALEKPMSFWNFVRFHVSKWPRREVAP